MKRWLPALLVVALGCGDDSPTAPPAGVRMSVEEQVAIEAALHTVVVKLQATGQPADSALADWTRIAARLIGRQGYQGTLAVSHQAPVARTDSMHAVAMLVTQGSSEAASQLHYLVAWAGLDPVAFTLRDAIAIVTDGDGQLRGVFPLGENSPSRAARYLHLAEGRGPYGAISGSLTVDAGEFGGDCPGTPDQPGFTCETGREAVGGEFTAVWAEQADTIAVSWGAVMVPAFHLTVE